MLVIYATTGQINKKSNVHDGACFFFALLYFHHDPGTQRGEYRGISLSNSCYWLIFQIISLIMDGTTGATQSRMKHAHNTKSFDMMFNMNLWSVLWLAIALSTGEAYDFALFAERNPHVLYNIIIFGLSSALGQVSKIISQTCGYYFSINTHGVRILLSIHI